MPRKRHLTEEEKAQIWRYHKENPLVTHTDVAAFFGVERSTVSKIVHQDQYQNRRYAEARFFSTSQEPLYDPVPNSEVEGVLDDYFRDSQRKGLPVTWAMVRKKAAIVAATKWIENTQKGGSPVPYQDGRGGERSSTNSTPRAVTPHSFSSTPNSQFPALTNEVTWTQPNLLRDTNNPLADRLCPTHCPSRSPSSNATSPIYSLGTTALNTQSYLSQDSPFNTEEILDIDKALELLSSPTHTIDPLPASQGSKSSHPSAAKDEGNSKIERALKVLSEHLAQSDKLTTTDLIALSHLQDRIKESRGR